MIDEQKLLQWVKDEKYIYGPPYDNFSAEGISENIGRIHQLNKLQRDIELGEFKQE